MPEQKEMAHTSMEEVMGLNSREFRMWTYLKFKSINSKLNLVITLLVVLLAAVLGLRVV